MADTLSGQFQSKYYSASENCVSLGTLVPKSMAFEQKRFNQRIKAEIGDIDEYVAQKLHYKSVKELCGSEDKPRFSREQIDAVATAIYTHEKTGNAIIIADQTGVGKGRIAAGLIRYAILDKKVIPFFITEKKHLIHDIYRDLIDIGFDAGIPEFKLTKDESVKKEYTDSEIIKIINEDIENDELRIEFDFDEGEDFKLLDILKDENIELFSEVVEAYKGFFQGEDSLFVYEYNKDRNKDIEAAIKNGLYEVKPFTPFPFSVKDKDGNILYSNDDKTVKSILKKGAIPSDYKLIAFPYSQISKPRDKKGVLTDKAKFLLKMASKTVVVMDESHSAAGFKADGELTNTAEMIQSILGVSQMVTFMSATFAKKPENMFLYSGQNSIGETGLSGLALKKSFELGDVALQEAVSSELVRIGQLIRREKEIMGETTYLEESDTTDVGLSQVNKLNKVAESYRLVSSFSQYVSEALNTIKKDEGVTDYKFAGKIARFQFQLFQFFILGLKVQQTSEEAIKQLNGGRKVVISIANTLESAFKNMKKDFINDIGYSIGDEVPNDFSLFLAYLLDYTLRIAIEKEVVGDNGVMTTEREIIKIKKSKDRIAKKLYDVVEGEYIKTLDLILGKTIGVSISPIDQIKTIIKSNGFSVDEITGRILSLEFDKDDFSKGKLSKRKQKKKEEIIRDFNTNKVDCVILNQAGAVGVSMHPIKVGDVDIVTPEPPTTLKNKKEVKQRCMIITQMELDINKEVQKLGRISRTGQVYPPIYRYIISCIPSESRFTALNEKKLRSLSANVSSDQTAASYLFEADDFYSQTAVEPFNESMIDLTQRERAENKRDIEQYTKRLYFTDYNFQKKFYDTFTEKLNKHVSFLKENGLYQGAVSLKDYKASDQQIYPFIIGNNDSLSSFGRHSVLEVSKCTEYELKNLEYDITTAINDKLATPRDLANVESFNKVSQLSDFYNKFFKEKLSSLRKSADDFISEKKTLIIGLENEIKELEKDKKKAIKLPEAVKLRDEIKSLKESISQKSSSVGDLLAKGDLDAMNSILKEVQEIQSVLKSKEKQLEDDKEFAELLEKESEYLKIDYEIERKKKDIEKIDNQINSQNENFDEYENNVKVAKSIYSNIGKIYDVTLLDESLVADYNDNGDYIGDKYTYNIISEKQPYVLTGFIFNGGQYANPNLGSMEIFLMGVTDKQTFSLSKPYRVFNENEISKGKKHTLILENTKVDYKDDKGGIGAWNKIASLIDTSYKTEKYILTGSLLKCFSTIQGVGVEGSITKYTTADSKQRIGIELSKKSQKSFMDRLSKVEYPVYVDLIPSNFRKLILDDFYDKRTSYDNFYHEIFQVGFKDKAFINMWSTANYYEKQNMNSEEFYKTVKVRILSEKMPLSEYLLGFIKSVGISDYLLLSSSSANAKRSKIVPDRYYNDYSGGYVDWKIGQGLGVLFKNIFPASESTYTSLLYYNTINTGFGIEMSLSDFFNFVDFMQNMKVILTTATSNTIVDGKKDFYIFEQNVDEMGDFEVGSNDQYFVQDTISPEVEMELDDIINSLLDILR